MRLASNTTGHLPGTQRLPQEAKKEPFNDPAARQPNDTQQWVNSIDRSAGNATKQEHIKAMALQAESLPFANAIPTYLAIGSVLDSFDVSSPSGRAAFDASLHNLDIKSLNRLLKIGMGPALIMSKSLRAEDMREATKIHQNLLDKIATSDDEKLKERVHRLQERWTTCMQSIQTPPTTGEEHLSKKWKTGIDHGALDPKWDQWDSVIQEAVNEYNQHLAETPGYVALDWKFVKAMLWTESGGGSPAWTKNPMQIGAHPEDPGMEALLSGKEGGNLIMPPTLKVPLTKDTIPEMPEANIRAGIGYLLMRAAKYEYKSIPKPGATINEVIIQKGNTLTTIADRNHSTVDAIKELNPNIDPDSLQIGQVIKYQEASRQRVITGWEPIDTQFALNNYNEGGDKKYAIKMDYALSKIIEKEKAISCFSD